MADALRFRAYLPQAMGSPVLLMPREDWVAAIDGSTGTVILNLDMTPLAPVEVHATVVVAYAERITSSEAEVSVVRWDTDDAPDYLNTDKYGVYANFPEDPRYPEVVAAASTEDNQDLRDFLSENVLLVKRTPDADHHRRELPSHIRLLMDRDEGNSPV